MSAESEIRTLLGAASAVTSLVSTRIRANRAEQGDDRPFVIFTRSATEVQQGLGGTVLATKVVFDVECWADTRLAAEALADAVQAALVADGRAIVGRASGYDGDLDLEASIVSVDWWD